jgi:hypothetical protein
MTIQDTRGTSPRYILENSRSYHPHRLEVWKMEIKNSDIIIGSVATCITILLAVLKGFGII